MTTVMSAMGGGLVGIIHRSVDMYQYLITNSLVLTFLKIAQVYDYLSLQLHEVMRKQLLHYHIEYFPSCFDIA